MYLKSLIKYLFISEAPDIDMWRQTETKFQNFLCSSFLPKSYQINSSHLNINESYGYYYSRIKMLMQSHITGCLIVYLE